MRRSVLLLLALFLPIPALAQDRPAQERPVLKSVERIRGDVSKMRGLEWQAGVKVGIKTAEDLRREVLVEFDREEPAAEFAREELVVKAFGFIPADYDLRAKLIEFMGDGVQGFYDPNKKELFVIDRTQELGGQSIPGMQGMLEEMFMAHELHHALQDQNFDLQRWFGVLEDHDDRLQAFKSLVEGEAQLVGMSHMFKRMGRGDVDLAQWNRMQEAMMNMPGAEAQKLRETPAFLVENMMFPYTQGAEFVQAIQRKYGWERLTAAFRDPPTSTEQILHPEKFLETPRDEPVELFLSDLEGPLGEGVEELDEGTLGEWNVVLLLRALGVSKRDAARGAAGWDGDAYAGFRTKDGRVVVLWLSTWDSAEEAAEFEGMYRPALQKRGGKDHLERRGAEVLWIHGASEAELPSLRRRGFAAVKATIQLEPLPGFVERPAVEEFTPGAAAPAPGAASGSAGGSPAAPGGLVQFPGLGLSVAVSPQLTSLGSGGELLLRADGREVRGWRIEERTGGVKESIKARYPEAGQVEETRVDRRVLGRPTRELTVALGQEQLRGLALEVDGGTLVLLARGKADLEALLATAWLDGRWDAKRLQTVSAPGAAVSFAAPEGWREAKGQGHVLSTLTGPDGATIQVVAAPATGSLEQIAEKLQRQLPALPGFALRVAGTLERRGQRVHELEFSADGRRTRQQTWLLGGQAITVAVSAPAGRFEALLPEFGRVLASVSVSAGKKESF